MKGKKRVKVTSTTTPSSAKRLDWSKMKERAARLVSDPSHTYGSAAEVLSSEFQVDVGPKSLELWAARNRIPKKVRTPVAEPPAHFFDVPVRPLAVSIPEPVTRAKGKYVSALLYGDTHHPYHDEPTLAVVRAIGEDLQPDLLVDMGDGVDAGHLSAKFKQDPMRVSGLQDEINLKREQLVQFRQAMPNSKYIYLEGNHEERMRRAMWNMEGPAKALIQLDVVQRTLTWPVLLGLDELFIDFYSYDEQTKAELLPKFILKHGTVVSQKSGHTALREMAKYGRSGASGHTHRLGVVWHRDFNGQHVWVETGCCTMLNPEYTQDPDWTNACVVLTFERNTGAVQVEPIEIRRGHTLWRGKEYRA